MKKLRVLVACEESQVVTIAFRELGHEAYSCDLEPCSGGHPDWHIQDDVLKHLDGWDMIIAFPTCTFLTVSANKWYKDQPPLKSGALVGAEHRMARSKAIEFFMRLANCKCERVAIENPIGIMSTVWRKPDQIIQPWMFGHGETKATCLWLRGLPKLKPTCIVKGRNQRIWKLPPTEDRSKLRSKTFIGIAKAIAYQWGGTA